MNITTSGGNGSMSSIFFIADLRRWTPTVIHAVQATHSVQGQRNHNSIFWLQEHNGWIVCIILANQHKPENYSRLASCKKYGTFSKWISK